MTGKLKVYAYPYFCVCVLVVQKQPMYLLTQLINILGSFIFLFFSFFFFSFLHPVCTAYGCGKVDSFTLLPIYMYTIAKALQYGVFWALSLNYWGLRQHLALNVPNSVERKYVLGQSPFRLLTLLCSVVLSFAFPIPVLFLPHS